MKALSDIKVLDVSRILAGPWCTQILSDLGADVTKVERVKYGDDTRSFAPPYLTDNNGENTKESTYFLSVNRGKKSIALDISTKKGQEIVRQLAKSSDVFVENYKVGGLAQYGLDYATLSKINPRLIYCSITGFGQYGPRASEPGYDYIIQGLGGLMSVTGEYSDELGGQPMKVGTSVIDIFTGLYATIGIQAALAEREKTGEGQYIDLALLDTQVAIMSTHMLGYLSTDVIPRAYGNGAATVVPYEMFKASDNHFIIACGNDSQFRSLTKAIDLPELADDPKFATNHYRVHNREEIVDLLSKHFLSKTADEWIERITKASVPVGKVNNVKQVLEEPQTIIRNMKVEIPHPLKDDFALIANPLKFSKSPIQYDTLPPFLGEHTIEVLKGELHYSDEQIEFLKADGVIDYYQK